MICMQDTFARARTRLKHPLGQALATLVYIVYNIVIIDTPGKKFQSPAAGKIKTPQVEW